MDDVLELIRIEYQTDENGVEREEKTRREVMCRVGSVTRSEFFEGGRSGLNPEYMFTLARADYMGEAVVVFHGKTYAVYRTYMVPNSDYIEVYVQREGGTNGKENAHC